MIATVRKKSDIILLAVISLMDISLSLGRNQTDNEWIIETSSRTADYAGVTMANGRIGIVVDQSPLTAFGKHTIAAATTFLFEGEALKIREKNKKAGFETRLSKNKNITFAIMGGICNSQNFNDPVNESERQPIFGLTNGLKKLLEKHQQAWEKIWENDIIIEGDPESQKDVRFALYNLFSFAKEGSRLSIPPMGLSAQGYNGHIFWDSELWMYPPLLVFDREMGKAMLDYRFDRLEQAKQKARVYGYRGAMYPWESDDTGEEVTPTWALTGAIEHHITADVGIAFWNYYCVTRDKTWLRDTGWKD